MLTGSPDHAVSKGRHRAEYTWFTLSNANPLLSSTADASVKRILKAMRRQEYHAPIGWPATAAKIANGLLPQTTTRLLDGDRHAGTASHSAWTDNPLTMLNTAAMGEMNQVPFVQSRPADAD